MRFELTRPFGLPVFKTGAINRSATPPGRFRSREVCHHSELGQACASLEPLAVWFGHRHLSDSTNEKCTKNPKHGRANNVRQPVRVGIDAGETDQRWNRQTSRTDATIS